MLENIPLVGMFGVLKKTMRRRRLRHHRRRCAGSSAKMSN